MNDIVYELSWVWELRLNSKYAQEADLLLALLLVGTVLLFGSRKSGLYTIADRERLQSGTIGTRVERAQLSRVLNSQS